jgi:HPt (histidine-containing phosphotransfer) domain-containing protein
MTIMQPRILPPVLDDRRLRKIAEDTTYAVAEQFATDYAKMLPRRILRISNALRAGDRKAALDAALSLKTSSALIGAFSMELICFQLQHALDRASGHEAETAFQEAKHHLPHLTAALANRTPAQIPLPA